MRLLSNRDLTIRQRRRPWKDPWKIDFASFHFFRDYPRSPSYLKRTEFRLEMKRVDRAQVQTEMVEFIGLPFPFSSKLKFWSFHVVVVQGRQRNVQKKRDARSDLLFCSLMWSVTSCYWIDARQMESFRFIAELPRARRSPVAIETYYQLSQTRDPYVISMWRTNVSKFVGKCRSRWYLLCFCSHV